MLAFFSPDDAGISSLSHLLKLYKSNPSAFPHLNPNTQNKKGDAILHIVFQKNLTKQITKVLGLLAKFDINFNLKNNLGRDIRYRIKKNDPMLIAWNDALSENKKRYRYDATGQKPTAGLSRSQTKNSAHSSITISNATSIEMSLIKGPNADKEKEHDSFKDRLLTQKECILQEITLLMQKIEFCEFSGKIDSETFEKPKELSSVAKTEIKEIKHQKSCGQQKITYSTKDACLSKNDLKEKAQKECKQEGEEHIQDNDQFQDVEMYIQDFDNMTWEIECTSEMLKKLNDKSMPRQIKNRVIFVIQQLGNGEWTQSLQKHLKHLKGDIQLYEVKLSKGSRMLWELAVDFSPRCSERQDKITEKDACSSAERNGRVYTEIIRLWDIVLDHDKLSHAIDTLHCIQSWAGLYPEKKA